MGQDPGTSWYPKSWLGFIVRWLFYVILFFPLKYVKYGSFIGLDPCPKSPFWTERPNGQSFRTMVSSDCECSEWNDEIPVFLKPCRKCRQMQANKMNCNQHKKWYYQKPQMDVLWWFMDVCLLQDPWPSLVRTPAEILKNFIWSFSKNMLPRNGMGQNMSNCQTP